MAPKKRVRNTDKKFTFPPFPVRPCPAVPDDRDQLDKFYKENSDLPETSGGFHIEPWISLAGVLRISVKIPPHAKERQMLVAWKAIGPWLARADAFNERERGGKPPTHWPNEIQRWFECKSEGRLCQKTYSDVAEDLNRSIMQHLGTAFHCVKKPDGRTADPMGTFAKQHAIETMTLLNVSKYAQEKCIKESQIRFHRGLPIFKTKERSDRDRLLTTPRLDGPITKTAVKGLIQANRINPK